MFTKLLSALIKTGIQATIVIAILVMLVGTETFVKISHVIFWLCLAGVLVIFVTGVKDVD